jgi:hypothetical protein
MAALNFTITNLNRLTVFLAPASVNVTGGATWGTAPPTTVPGRGRPGSHSTSNTVRFDATNAPANSTLRFDYIAQIVVGGGTRVVNATLSFRVRVDASSTPTINAQTNQPNYIGVAAHLSGVPGNYAYAITITEP